MSRNWAILAVASIVAALAGLAAQPMMAFGALASAARDGDAGGRLERSIDFPALRENLKAQLETRAQAALRRDRGLRDSPFGALGALIAPGLVDRVVDATVTPEGVAAILTTGRAPFADLGRRKTALPPPPETAAPAASEPAGARPASKPRTRYAYRDLNTFVARRDGLTWVLSREGLGWKLTNLELPAG